MEINVMRTLLILLVGGIITFLSRSLPFLLFRNRQVPKVITYLGKVLPMAIICVMIFFCIKDIHFRAPGGYLPYIISLAVTAAVHLWKKNTFLSITCGTVCYMLLVQLVF